MDSDVQLNATGSSDYFPDIKGLNCTNSQLAMTTFELSGSVTIRNSTVNAVIDLSGYDITNLVVVDSDVQLNATGSSDYFPDIKSLNCTNSQLTMATVELSGSVTIRNSTVNAVIDLSGYDITNLLVVDSDVQLNATGSSSYFPDIKGLNCTNSQLAMATFELSGSVIIRNSTVIALLDYSSYYSSITSLEIIESTVLINNSGYYTSELLQVINILNSNNAIVTLVGIELYSTIANSSIIRSNVTMSKCLIDNGISIFASNFTITASLVYMGDHDFWIDNMSNITSSGSIGYLDFWRTIDSTDLIVSTILCLPEGYNVTMQWKNSTFYSSPFIETYPDLEQSYLSPEIYYANFTVPKNLYSLNNVYLKLVIKNESIIVWESKQWTLPVMEMIPTVDLTHPQYSRWEGIISLIWNISEGDLDSFTFNIYLHNSTGKFIITEGTEFYEYDFNTTAFSDGPYTLEIKVGDFSSTAYEIFIDNVNDAPTVSIRTPYSWGSYSYNLSINWDMGDPNEDNLNVSIYYSVDQVVWYLIAANLSNSPFSWNITHMNDGNYYLKIDVSDGYLKATQIVQFRVYNPKPPTIQILSPLAGNQLSGEVHISWKASDPNPSDVLDFSIYYGTDNSSWVLLIADLHETSWKWNIEAIEPGSYYILVGAFDGIIGSSAIVGPFQIVTIETTSSEYTELTTSTTTELSSSSQDAFGFELITILLVLIFLKKKSEK